MSCHCHCEEENEHEHEHHHHGHENEKDEAHERKKEILILSIRIAISLVIILLATFLFSEENYGLALNLTLSLVAWLIVSYDVLIEAFKGMFLEHRPFDEETLMIVASIGAFCLRFFGPDNNEFLEAVLVILLFQVGEVFEDLAADKAKGAITKAIDLRSSKARVETEGGVVMKTPEELQIGDIVILGAGEKILCDGEVVKGEAGVDESSLTGESVPQKKTIGSKIFSMTIVKSGSLEVRVEKEYKDSTAAKLLSLVEESAEHKSKSTRFITKFSRIYTPVVVLLALLVAVVPPLFIGISDGSVWSTWIYTALCFLVVSCPCAIVISVPLAYFSGLGLASKKGIIVKGAGYFDQLNELRMVAFDKTGTLTKGQFALSKVEAVGLSQDEMLTYLRAAESRSTHPLAHAICEGGENLSDEVSDYEEISGNGVKAVYQGHSILAGKRGFLLNSGIHAPDISEFGSLTYLAVDGTYSGYVVLKDEERPSSKDAIAGLKKRGIQTIMLSGDKKETVEEMASSLGLDQYQAELLPEEKTSFIDARIKEGKGAVAFVGDGINDAPSIVRADVGVAMGGFGSDMAISNADVALMHDDPYQIVPLLDIAHKTKNRALFNIIFSLLVKFGVMIASVVASAMGTWSVPLWVAVLADSGLAALMILSSLLLTYSRVGERK